jgi:hypothetical protein
MRKHSCPLWGYWRTLKRFHWMSALPPKADIVERDRHVRFVPKAEVAVIRSVELIVQPGATACAFRFHDRGSTG